MFPRPPKPTDKLSSRRRKLTYSDVEDANNTSSVVLEYEKNDDEVMWLDEIDHGSISSDGNSTSLTCAKLLSASSSSTPQQQRPWSNEEVNLALSQLPAGDTALLFVPTIKGETLNEALEEVRSHNLSDLTLIDRKLSIPCFANGGVRKASLAAENDEAASSKPGIVLAKWPETCLLVSCWLGHWELVKVLLDRGVNVKARDGDGRTPLHLAACSGSSKIIEELLKHRGTDPNDWDNAKEHTALHCTAAIGDVVSMRYLIKSGANIDAGLPGRTPLHYAVLSDVSECVKILLEAGACPNNPQVYTETPLHVAAGLGATASVTLLLSHGADVRVQCGSARSTPLHLAAEEANPRCTELLLAAGAPSDAKDSRGRTAMHLAALAQSAETLEHLIRSGGNVNAEDNDGRGPLHTAVAKGVGDGGGELIRMLIQAGARVNKPDKFGYVPLHIAALNESSPIVILLLSKGADVTARTKGGVSALSFIIRKTPEVIPRLVARLDQAITLHDHELGDVDCELRLDFRPLVPGGRGETDLMLCLVEVGQRHILKHPLCESFLYLKWLRIRKFFLFSLVFHAIFVAIFTGYVAVAFFYDLKGLTKVFVWPVGAFTCVLTCKEVFQMAHGVSIYAKRWENWLQWGVIVASCAVLVKPPDHDWQHHAAALGVLLVWIELMMIIGRFPMFGLYVQMFTQVAMNFFKFLGAYACLIVGFSFGFSVLHKNYKSFENPIVGLLKTIIMMSGELEFEDVFFDPKEPILYPGTAHLMLLVFVVLVTIILTNLMVGLAVSDIQELRRCAGLDRLVRRAELVAHLESMLFSKLLDRAPRRIIRACRKGALLLQPPHYCAIHVRPNDPRENRLPSELIKAVYRLVTERKTRNRSIASDSVTATTARPNRLYSVTSTSDGNYQQLTELATELKRCSLNIAVRLDALTTRVESVAREIDTQGGM